MVQIMIKLNDDSSIPEYGMIEMQGELESKKMSADLKGSFVGDLHFSKDGSPLLIIGHHILHGKCVDIEKPILVMKKTSAENDSNKSSREYRIQAVIKKKLIFKNRPKPIVPNALKNN